MVLVGVKVQAQVGVEIGGGVPRWNPLGDLRISQAQVELRLDLGLAREFAMNIERLKDKDSGPIYAPRRGNPAVMDRTHHIYTNGEDPSKGWDVLPHEYKKAIDKRNKIEQQPTGEWSI